jgi:hypothetical protein
MQRAYAKYRKHTKKTTARIPNTGSRKAKEAKRRVSAAGP